MATANSKILTYRGQGYMGNLDPYDASDPDADTSVISNAMVSMGIISKLTVQPTIDRIKVQEWASGNDATAESWIRASGGTIKMLADTATPGNIAIALSSRVKVIAPGSVTAAKIAYRDPVTRKYSELDDTTALKANVPYYFVESIADDALSYNAYELIDTSTFVLTDSSGTPKTLTVNTDYTINAVTGKLLLKGTAGHGVNLSGLTYPLQADFDMGLFVDTLPMPLVQNKPYMLTQKNCTGIVVKDSSATPKIISDAFYDVDSDYGMVTITDRESIMGVSGLTPPLKVYGVQGTTTAIGILSEGLVEKQIRFNGKNVRTGQKVAITFYKVSFDATAIDFFDKDYTKVPLEGELMADPSKPDDGPLGQFGKIEYL